MSSLIDYFESSKGKRIDNGYVPGFSISFESMVIRVAGRQSIEEVPVVKIQF